MDLTKLKEIIKTGTAQQRAFLAAGAAVVLLVLVGVLGELVPKSTPKPAPVAAAPAPVAAPAQAVTQPVATPAPTAAVPTAPGATVPGVATALGQVQYPADVVPAGKTLTPGFMARYSTSAMEDLTPPLPTMAFTEAGVAPLTTGSTIHGVPRPEDLPIKLGQKARRVVVTAFVEAKTAGEHIFALQGTVKSGLAWAMPSASVRLLAANSLLAEATLNEQNPSALGKANLAAGQHQVTIEVYTRGGMQQADIEVFMRRPGVDNPEPISFTTAK